MKTNKILILGATGNLGGLTAGILSEKYPDHDLRLTTSRESNLEKLTTDFPGSEVMCADWYDVGSLSNAMKDVNRVFVVTPDFTTDETQVSPNIIQAAKSANCLQQIVRLIAIPPGLSQADLDSEILDTRCGAAQHVVAKPLFDDSGLPITYINVACWIMFNLPWFLAEQVAASRQLVMPHCTDAKRRWVAEEDIAEVAAKILTDPAVTHVGKEYLMTGEGRYDFSDVAEMLSQIIGEAVVYMDGEGPLRATMGDDFKTLMTYFRHETKAYQNVPACDAVQLLLGRPQITLKEYLQKNRNVFL